MSDVYLVAREVLYENQNLTQRLKEVNHKISIKNVQQYNLETRLENLDIFEEHMTSLKLRCEFLDRQITNLEKQKYYIADQSDNFARFNDFNFKMEWRTTETTLENLCTEFKYLKEQLDQANEQISMDTSFMDDSMLSSRSKVNSMFSENEPYSTTDSSSISGSEDKEAHTAKSNISLKENHSYHKKKLLKMESFLNFKDTKSNANVPKQSSGIQLKGFKISNTVESPFYERTPKTSISTLPSANHIKKRLELIDLPSITEEYSSDETVSAHTNTVPTESHCQKGFYNMKGHYHHLSMPDTSSLEESNILLTPKDSLKHFISDDLNLRSRYRNRDYKITNFLFDNTIKSHQAPLSPQLSSFKDSYLDENDENPSDYEPDISVANFELESSDEGESYGSENATPLILRKQSKHTLYRTQSHDSILTVLSRSTRNFPLREKNLDLKAQTMKWLKPNEPVVSSATISQTTTADVSSSVSQTAHENIMNFLNSGGNTIESTPMKQKKSFTISHSHNGSWIPTKIFASPIPVPKKELDEVKPSWISSLISGSGFATEGYNSDSRIIKKAESDTLEAYRFPKRETASSFNGPSSLIIPKNGNRIIRHVYGSSFNDTTVISSRISYGALREALQHDIV